MLLCQTSTLYDFALVILTPMYIISKPKWYTHRNWMPFNPSQLYAQILVKMEGSVFILKNVFVQQSTLELLVKHVSSLISDKELQHYVLINAQLSVCPSVIMECVWLLKSVCVTLDTLEIAAD